MKKNKNKIAAILVAIILAGGMYSCQFIKDVSNAVTNIKRLQFKIDNVSNFKIENIGISNKSSLSSFSLSDIPKFISMVSSKRFPVSFIVNVKAKNPNDGTGGAPQSKATIGSLPWTLYINSVRTVSGDINKSIYIPGTGQEVNIPIIIQMDLLEFFNNKGYKELINLALSLGGVSGSSSNIQIKTTPTINTSFGKIKYPGELTIINKKWSN